MRTQLSTHDNRLSKLENILSNLKSSIPTVQVINSEIAVEQSKINSLVYKHEDLIRNLNKETQESGRKAGAWTSPVQDRIRELEGWMNEVRMAN